MSELSRQLPPLATLVVFEAAVRLQSFSRAADECALSQASVSRQMRQLEENLDTRLFERQRYDVSPTEAGKRLYESVRRALGELAATASDIRQSAQGGSRFTIYSDLSIGTSILAPLIGRFQELYPGIKFNILSSYEPIEQTRSAFDIGFQPGRRGEEYFDVETIADDLVFPVCSPDFAENFKDSVTAIELSTLPLLHLEYDSTHNIGWTEFLASYRIRENMPTENLVFSSYQVVLDVAERGDGVALGWARSVNSRIGDGKLVRFSDLSFHVTDGVAAYTRKQAQPNPVVTAVIDEVRASLGNIVSAKN